VLLLLLFCFVLFLSLLLLLFFFYTEAAFRVRVFIQLKSKKYDAQTNVGSSYFFTRSSMYSGEFAKGQRDLTLKSVF
jgi:hypothetical protein